jgi:5'-3' exonuclease
MGIKYFFSWFKKNFSNHIRTLKTSDKLHVEIDTLLIDMNGIFHYCAQKAFQYGSFKQSDDSKSRKSFSYNQRQKYLLKSIGIYIDTLFTFVSPRLRIVLCTDGVAPTSKQNQQRQRRYKNGQNKEQKEQDFFFDSNSITPGTVFMDIVSRYIDWFIKEKLSTDPKWKDIEVVYSDEKVPGEGEHKLVSFVRKYGETNEQFMIHGMDADLIMLSLASTKENFHILRDNPYQQQREFFYIDIKSVRETLVHILLKEQTMLPTQFFINDFILLVFMTGNDFLPHLPTIDILEGSIEQFFELYKDTFLSFENLVTQCNTINVKALHTIIGTLAQNEIEFIQKKSSQLVQQHKNEKGEFNWEEYRKEYYKIKMNCLTETDIEKACFQYIEGMQWVLTYYTEGVSCWKWYYPYQYAPFCSDISKSLEKYRSVTDKIVSDDRPVEPFFQLLSVLPPASSSLLPTPLYKVMSIVKHSYPVEFEIDRDGVRNEWEGIVLLPPLDIKMIQQEYKKNCKEVDKKHFFRNKTGSTIIYKNNINREPFQVVSYYGTIYNCIVETIKLKNEI